MAVWQWLFLIEGIISVTFGFIVFLLLPPVPERLTWGWSAKQKEIAVRRSREAYNVTGAKIHLKQLLDLVKDAKAWFYGKSSRRRRIFDFNCFLFLIYSQGFNITD
jgi:hypothetical protein